MSLPEQPLALHCPRHHPLRVCHQQKSPFRTVKIDISGGSKEEVGRITESVFVFGIALLAVASDEEVALSPSLKPGPPARRRVEAVN